MAKTKIVLQRIELEIQIKKKIKVKLRNDLMKIDCEALLNLLLNL